MPPRRERAARAAAREEVRKTQQEPEVPQPLPPQGRMTAAEVAEIVAKAVNAAITAMARHFPRNQPQPLVALDVQAHPGPSEWERARETFQKGHPPEFQGSLDVIAACHWKRDIQRHLRMVDCSEVQKQLLATFKLEGAALQWWVSITTVEERDTMTIAEFWVRFDRRYFSPAGEVEMRRKFSEVTQGDRSVAEYEEEFTRLANFLPDEVNNEERKKAKFMDGLAWRIRQHLIGNPALVTYTDVVHAALLHCQDHRFHLKRRKRGVESSQPGKAGGGSANGASQQQTVRQQGPDSRQGNPVKRFRSGGHRPEGQGFRQGQQRQNLGQGVFSGRCFICGETGHMKRDCPMRGRGQLHDEVLDVQSLQQVMGQFKQEECDQEFIDQEMPLALEGVQSVFRNNIFARMVETLFEDIFRVDQLDPDGKKFDRVSRVEARSEQFDMYMQLDVNTEIYPMHVGEKFMMVLAATLNLDGTRDTGYYTQAGRKSLADKFEYVMNGKLYRISEEGSGPNVKADIYVSFGGLLMMLKGDPSIAAKFELDQRLFILMRKV